MAIEIVDFPIRPGDFSHSYVKLPEGKSHYIPYIPYKSPINPL